MPERGAIPSGPKARTIVALILGRVSRARLGEMPGRGDEIIFVDTCSGLRAALLKPMQAITVIAEARDRSGESCIPLLREVCERMPGAATIGYALRHSSTAEILELASCGIDELIQEGVDDMGIALSAAFAGSIEACAARAVRTGVGQIITGPVRTLVDYCLQYPREDLSIEGIAYALGVHRKTLLNQCTRAGLPSPSALVMWARLMLAAAVLESTGFAVERVALDLAFASPSAFRNACRRHARLKPSDWRHAGGLAAVLASFSAACSSSP